MRPALRRRLGAAALLVAVALVLLAPAALAAGDAKSAKAATEDEIDARMFRHLPSLLAVVFLRFGVAVAGVVLLALKVSRWNAVRKGFLPPTPPPPPPPPLWRPPTPATPHAGSPTLQGVGYLASGLLVFAAVAALQVLLSGLLARSAGDWPALARALVATAVPMALVAVLVLRRRARVLRDPGPPAVPLGTALVEAGSTFCVAGALLLAVSIAWGLLLRGLGVPLEVQPLVPLVSDGPLVDAVTITAFGILVAPLTEECLFRVFLYSQVRAVTRPVVAAAGTAVMFARVHDNAFAFAPLCALAWLLANLYERTRSFAAVASVHALFNASTLLPLLLLRSA